MEAGISVKEAVLGCQILGSLLRGSYVDHVFVGNTKGRPYLITSADRIFRIGQLWKHLKQDEVIYYAPAKKLMPCKFFLNHVWTIQALEKHIRAGHFYIYKPLNNTHKIEVP